MGTQTDAERLKELYDVERHVTGLDGMLYVDDPYPTWAELQAQAPVHKGSVRELMGFETRGAGYGISARQNVKVYSAFTFEAVDTVLRENEVFSSKVYAGGVTAMMGGRTILEMGGEEHRRYRALAQPAFSVTRTQWWIDKWISALVEGAISAIEHNGRAELNTDLCAHIPLQTITASFGLTNEEALDFREGAEEGQGRDEDQNIQQERQARAVTMLKRVIEERRVNPQDDIITVLVQSEIEENGQRHHLTDQEISAFARLILTAGSGTTWRQLGILLVALLREPALLEAVRNDRELLRRAIDEVVRWEPTDPIFRRLVTRDVELSGVQIPAGAIVEMVLGAANHDPARWENPHAFDPYRALKPNLGFAGGPHVCIGMHVARAEMWVATNGVLDRLPNLRVDPAVPAPLIIGFEHRGPNAIPVLFG